MDLTRQETKQLIEAFNNTTFPFPEDKTLVDLFLDQATIRASKIALIYKEQVLTFKELDELSNQFANYLVDNKNTSFGDHIGLMIDRSEWLIVSILGILKVGAVYVPIDKDLPERRQNFIVKDSSCKLVINSTVLENFLDSKLNLSDKLLYTPKIDSEQLAYIIYTSGTTGNPKGVMVSIKSIVNLIFAQSKLYGVDETDNILQFSNYFFDASVEQIFLGLCNGATLTMVDKAVLTNHQLPDFIQANKITHLNATPSYLETIADLHQIHSLKRIIAGGEACSIKLAKKLSKIGDFYNAYGPTENTVTSTLYKFNINDKFDNKLPIGKPIYNTKAYILSEDLEVLPIGSVGELYLSGAGLVKGYLNLPELTAQSFINNPFKKNSLMYKTGDLAKWLPNGYLEFAGRKDDQIKIRGYRIELGEIEAAIKRLPKVQSAIVTVSTDIGDSILIAYVVSDESNKDVNSFRIELANLLPEYMVPNTIIWLDSLPMTANGKVDKKKLPNPKFQRPTNAPPLKKSRTEIEKTIEKIWSKALHIQQISVDDNFFELGGNSLLTQKVAVQIGKELQREIGAIKIYQYPTIAGLANTIQKANTESQKEKSKEETVKTANRDIAVIGMAGRFPGASSIDELWDVLQQGKETITFFTKEELDQSIPEALRNDPMYLAARGIVPSAKEFDARFFGLNPKLAEAMDPQQRLFLEITWEVLEKSGHLPNHYDGLIGVYAGVNTNTYYLNNVFPNKALMAQIGSVQANTVNDKDYIATRTAYHLNLKGPAVSVHSACSTSLLAIAEAVEAIRNGQCDAAIAGGSSVTAPMNSGHLYQEGSMLSADGRCRTFDKDSTGTMFCDGAGVVLLKKLEQAINDGDYIHGVIKGVGLSNDGGDKGSFTAPSVDGQATAIKHALIDGNINPADISYVEAHGTATPLGDPIEIEGLKTAFGPQKHNQYCAIGSVKSNMGHLTAAAGVAGFIKIMLAMKHHQIPASLGFENPNPAIDFVNSPFYVNDKLIDWQSDGLKKAGVSSFGVGGTNVHVVVEEYLNPEPTELTDRPLQLLTWSAKSEKSLYGYQEALGEFFNKRKGTSLERSAYSLTMTREDFSQRSFVIATNAEEASRKLLSLSEPSLKSHHLRTMPNHLAFLFPGQGAQYLQMGKALYENEDVFRSALDQCANILLDEIQLDIKAIVYPDENLSANEELIKNTKFTQPALFVVEYALAKLLMSWDIHPTLFIGHSIGEFVAAHFAGVMNLKDAILLVAKRGQLVSELPGGSMLSVRASASEIKSILPSDLSIAAINSDSLCVVSGADDAIENFSKELKNKNIANMLLLTSHAFHSSMMDPALDDFKREVEKIGLNIPQIPIISSVTGKVLQDNEATDINYWVNHLREAVDFSSAMDTMLSYEDALLLEVGPGRALTTLSKQKKGEFKAISISTLTIPKDNQNSYHTVFDALGQLWLHGIEPDWKAFYNNRHRPLVELPAYVFDRKPCWAEPPVRASVNPSTNNLELQSNLPQIETQPQLTMVENISREDTILQKISEIIMNNSGIELVPNEYDYSFLELGLDSLVLTQMAITCKNEFNTPITFRQLNDEFSTPSLLAKHLDGILPESQFKPKVNMQAAPVENMANVQRQNSATDQSALGLIAQQLNLLSQQVNLLQGNTNTTPVQVPPNKIPQTLAPKTVKEELTEDEKKEHSKPFGASPKINRKADGLSPSQQTFLDNLIKSYNSKTAGSKSYTQKHRSHMSDPRVVSGFKPLTKEMVYPIVVDKSSGNRFWDIDGNEYLDTLNGFGSCLFGHQPEFVKEALHKQIESGYEVGPQHPLAGEVCEMLCEMTGHDRAALCNTGSEAVLGAMRIARTVTGKSLIVAFSRSYHGINDEVIVRGSKIKKTFPAASGILPEAVQNMLILDYGTEESLNIIRERADEIAAVLVEPVQSRRPDFQPIEFLKEVRKITEASESTLIFDEIITGFRMHPGGAQALFGIKADIATYGKVIGGGISIGAIIGKRKFMDALDGGHWEYGDDSFPEVGVTYFAGTFVRHPLALASTKAALLHLKTNSPGLQDRLALMTKQMALELNAEFRKRHLPIELIHYRSLWRIKFLEEIPYSELLFILMRQKGIHIWDGFPCYLTESYTQKDVMTLVECFIESIDEMTEAGIFGLTEYNRQSQPVKKLSSELNTPPVFGAKLGMDEEGNPAWYVKDDNNDNEYVKIDVE